MKFDLKSEIPKILLKLVPICNQLFNIDIDIGYYIINEIKRPDTRAYYDANGKYIVFQRPIIFKEVANIGQLRDLVIHEVAHLIQCQYYDYNELPNILNGMGHTDKFFEVLNMLEATYPDKVEKLPFKTYFSTFSKRINYCILKLKNYSKKSKVKIHELTDAEFEKLSKNSDPKYIIDD